MYIFNKWLCLEIIFAFCCMQWKLPSFKQRRTCVVFRQKVQNLLRTTQITRRFRILLKSCTLPHFVLKIKFEDCVQKYNQLDEIICHAHHIIFSPKKKIVVCPNYTIVHIRPTYFLIFFWNDMNEDMLHCCFGGVVTIPIIT